MTFIIYLIGTIDGVNTFFATITAGALLAVFVIILRDYLAVEKEVEFISKATRSVISGLIVLSLVAGLLWTIIPNSKTVAAMYLIPAVVKNKKVQAIPDKTDILNLKLDEWIDELKNEGKNTHRVKMRNRND